MRKGFIYILSNNSLKDNLFKIGKTSKDTTQRTKQLSSSTSIPENFEILYEFEFNDLNWAEREIHKELDKFRYNKKKEFFHCDIEIAKLSILKIQVQDKNIQINSLKTKLETANKIISGNEFIKSKWAYFFKNLNWDFEAKKLLSGNLESDFIIKTKDWFSQYNDETNHEEILINIKETHVFIIPNLKFDQFNWEDIQNILEIQNINEIQNKSNEKNRLLIISNNPFETYQEVYVGWKYEFHKKSWEICKFIETEKKYGLFEENPSWFCFVNGLFLERDNLFPNPKKIIELWK